MSDETVQSDLSTPSLQGPTLEYSQVRPPLMTIRQWLIVTYVCGLLPMAVTVITTLLYLVSHFSHLEPFGIFIAVTGMLIVMGGGVAWLIWVFKTREFYSRRWWLRTATALLLLLLNVPIFLACAMAVRYWRFTVVNESSMPMTVSIAATRTGQTKALGTIEPGDRKRFYWRINGGGDFFNVTSADPVGPRTASFYVRVTSPRGGADVDLQVNPGGSLNVK